MTSSPAALLLDPKSYKRQNTAGNISSPVSNSSFYTVLDHAPPPGYRLSQSSQSFNLRGTSDPPVASGHYSFTSSPTSPTNLHTGPMDDLISLKGQSAYTSFKGRPPARNYGAASSPEPNIDGAPVGTVFDPRQLLNSGRFRSMNRSRANTPSSRNTNTLNRADSKEGEPLDQTLKREFDESAGESPINMIEDIYGVTRRVHQPQKKFKIESQNNHRNTNATFSGSGNSLIGGYMKESSDKTSQPVSVADTVDLTLDNDDDDDDDVIFVANKDLGAEEVCYGKLEGATVLAHLVPTPSPSVFGGNTPDWPSIRCELLRNRSKDAKIEVKDPSNRIFGRIDPHTAAALVLILDMATDVRTQARLDVRRKRPNEWPAGPCSDAFRISINLYGTRRLSSIIGGFLSQKNVWLGTPNAVDAGIATLNPHAERRLQAAAAVPNKPTFQSETRTTEEVTSAVTKMFDQLRSAQNLPEMETPNSLKTPLLPHQKQALWYMMEKEKPRNLGAEEEDNNSLWRIKYQNGRRIYHEIISGVSAPEEPAQVLGGLLADMMGLGKTLSILSLLCSTMSDSVDWVNTRSTNPSTINIKTTLLVCPLSAVGNWVNQIKEHLKERTISYYVFHGPSRTEDPRELAQYDLVITTYSTVLSDMAGKSSKRGVSPLTQVNLFRIVLDEAHAIREQSTAQSQAIFQLEAQRRWSVTGTPIQNRLEDLGSVTKFLRLYPYNEKGRFTSHIISPFKCDNPNAVTNLRVLVDSFTLRRVKDRIDLPPRHDQTIMLEFSEQEKKLHDFFKKESNFMMNVVASESREKIGGKMYHIVLKAMMILRQISAHGKELLDQEDRERFRGLSANDAIDLEELDSATSASAADRKAYEMLVLMRESSVDTCARCGNSITLQPQEDSPVDKNSMAAAMLPCYDILCPDCFGRVKGCLDENAGTSVQLGCLFCNSVISSTYSIITTAGFEQYLSTQVAARQNRKQVKALGQYEGPHTKTKALISHLLNTVEENKRSPNEAPIKSVIFSSWTSHLDLIEIALEDNGIRGYTRLDGSMSLKQRNAALEIFAKDDKITVLLATLGAGGVGLNLTSASRVFVMEPQYNPAAVAQAVDRVHRLGQTREVTTVQFMMKNSIEEKIAELAKRKQKLADMSLNRKMDRRELQQERLNEYRSLFK